MLLRQCHSMTNSCSVWIAKFWRWPNRANVIYPFLHKLEFSWKTKYWNAVVKQTKSRNMANPFELACAPVDMQKNIFCEFVSSSFQVKCLTLLVFLHFLFFFKLKDLCFCNDFAYCQNMTARWLFNQQTFKNANEN